MPTVLRPIAVSARTEENMGSLLQALEETLSPGMRTSLVLPTEENWKAMVSFLHDRDEVTVLDVVEGGDRVEVHLACEPAGLARTLKALGKKFGTLPGLKDV